MFYFRSTYIVSEYKKKCTWTITTITLLRKGNIYIHIFSYYHPCFRGYRSYSFSFYSATIGDDRKWYTLSLGYRSCSCTSSDIVRTTHKVKSLRLPWTIPAKYAQPPTPPSNVGRGKLATHGNFSCDMQIRLKPLNERSTLLGERGRW